MITAIKINGFKSFQNFEMTFTPLTVVAGANASGKSNLFDALQLLSHLADKDLKSAFKNQRGNPNELFTQYDEDSYSTEMEFEVEMLVHRTVRDNWGGQAELKNTRLRYKLILQRTASELGIDDLAVKAEHLEKIKPEEDKWVKQLLSKESERLWKGKVGASPKPFITTTEQDGVPSIRIRQDGRRGGKATPANAVSQTVLGGVNSVDFPHAFAVKEEMRNWKFLQLNPEDLRQPTLQDVGLIDRIMPSGQNLAAALFRIKRIDEYNLKEISRKLNSFLPNLTEVNVYDDKANRQFIIKVKGEDGKEFSSRVLSEGTLRLLALCILEYDDKHTGLLCFEEPENGIHPFRMKAMAQLLKDLSANFSDLEIPLRQVIVNTHSPVMINEVMQWQKDKTVSVWWSRLDTLVSDTNGRRTKTKITRMSPILLTLQEELFPVSEQERKLTMAEAIRYLQTAETESTIKAFQ